MDKPSLHEIAAMPFPASMLEMRKHYNSNWGKPLPEDGYVRSFKVVVRYSIRANETRTYQVEAASEQEAEQIAEELFDKDRTVEPDADVDEVEVTEVEHP